MDYRYRISQEELAYIYEHAQDRMAAHPEVAEEHKKIIGKLSFFKSEREALLAAINLWKENHWRCQIWAKVEKVGDTYRVQNFWFVIYDGKIKLSADYIGMALMYDETRLSRIIDDVIPMDEVIAYY